MREQKIEAYYCYSSSRENIDLEHFDLELIEEQIKQGWFVVSMCPVCVSDGSTNHILVVFERDVK